MKKTMWVLSVLIFLIVLAPAFLIAMIMVLTPWPMTNLFFYWTPVALAGTLVMVLWYYNSYHKNKEEEYGDNLEP